MADAGRDLTNTLFGAPTATAAPVDQWRQTLKLDDLERQHNIPSGLMTSVLRQESGGDPRVKSSAGAQGLFQFMPATAAQYKIDPFDPQQAAPAAAKELSTLYKKYRGDVDRTLAAWNWGQGNVDRKGMANMPSETRGFLTNVKRFLSPGVAEAVTPTSGRDLTSSLGQESQGGGRDLTDLLFQPESAPQKPPEAPGRPQTPPQTAPAPPTQPGASQGPLVPSPDPSPTPGMRFQALPSIQQLEPADRMQKTILFESLKPAEQEEFLRSEEPAAGGLAVGGGPVKQAPAVTDPAARLAGGRGTARPWREGDPLAPGQKRPGVPDEAPLEEQNPAQTWIDTALDVGYGAAGAIVGGATGGLPGMMAGPVIAQGVLDRARMQLGMRPQEKAVFELGPVNVYQSDLLNAGFSLLLGTPDIVKGVLSRSKAGQAIRAADDATRAAHHEWQTAAAEARAAQQAGRQEAYQTAERKALDGQARYQQRVQARDATIQANQQTYDEALTQYQQEVQQTRAQSHRETTQDLTQQQATHQGQVRQQAADVAAQGQAVQTARAVPGRYSPQTPSWVLYEKFGDAAKDAVVDLAPAKTALAEVRASRGLLPDGTARPLPAAVESIATNLEKATGETSIKTIREELRRLGPLTRSQDGNVRGAAKQLYGIYADVLEASPVANDLLRQANATFRKEMALQDVQEWLRPGHGVVRIDQQGRETINVGALLTRLEKQVGDDALFAGSFGPNDLQSLRQDFSRLAGTPKMPTRTLTAPRPELLPGSAPDVPARLQTPPTPPGTPAEVPQPRRDLLPGGAGPGRRTAEVSPEPAAVTPRQALGERPPFAGPRAGTWGAVLATMTAMGVPAPLVATVAGAGAVHVTQQQARWLMAHALLDPKRRGLMQAAMDGQNRLNPRVYGALVATLSPEEKQAYRRETRR